MLFLQQPNIVEDSGEYLVRNYTVEDGLPVNAVNDIVQDESGYLYFATFNGLVRYDGYDFVTYNASNSPGITTNRFIAIRYSSTNDLWLFSETGEVTLYRKNVFHTFNENDGVKDDVLTWDEGSNGEIWIGTRSGFLKFDSDSFTFQKPITPDVPQLPTHSIQVLSNTIIGINKKHVFRYSNGHYTPLFTHEKHSIDNIGALLSIRIDDNTALIHGRELLIVFNSLDNTYHKIDIKDLPKETLKYWNAKRIREKIILSTSEGLFEINLAEEKLESLNAEEYSFTNKENIVKSESGALYAIGNYYMLNGKRLHSTNGVDASFQDTEGSVWIATRHDGLKQYQKSIIENITTGQNVYSIIQAMNGDIWAGSFISGVYRFRGENIQHWDKTNSNLVGNRVRFLYEDHDGTIFASLWDGGLWQFNGEKWSYDSTYEALIDGIDPVIEAMYRLDDGSLIIGTQGPTIIDRFGELLTMKELTDSEFTGVRTIYQRKDGLVFLGSNGNGLGILSPTNSFKKLTEKEGLSSNYIRDIFIQSSDTLWLATENRGLNRLVFNSEDSLISVHSISTKDGLTNNDLHRIIKDNQQNLWVSSNKGIMKLSLFELNNYLDKNTKHLAVIGYNHRNGMINPEANGGVQSAGIFTKDQKIWFPNQKGITIIDPNIQESVNSIGIKEPVIEHISIKDTTLSILNKMKEVRVDKGVRNFSIHFTAPNFAFPERTVFRYKMEDVHNNWIIADESRSAFFTNMDPGTYQFEVQAEQSGGSISMTSLLITIPPYFHETQYFQFLVGLCLIGLGFLVYRYRVHSLKVRERELQKRVKAQTRQLEQAAEEKSRFFTGITHELKTPLSLMLGPLDELSENINTTSISKFKAYTQMMQRNGYRLKNLIDQILDVSKLNADAIKLNIHPFDIVKLTKQITGQFQSLLNQKGITLDIYSDSIEDDIYLDKEAWERIIINLISNAIKFSPNGGRIVLTITDFEKNIKVSIRDYGEGIPLKDQHKVFEYLYQVTENNIAEGTGIGLYLVKGLLERMGGEVAVQSTKGDGAEFIVTLKKGSSHFYTQDIVSHTKVEIEESKKKVTKVESLNTGDKKKVKKTVLANILIVEDNADFREHMSSLLSQEYDVTVAENGKEGLSLVKKISPDIVISDVMMPVMNGYEFVYKLREIEKFRQTPVLFLSAKDQEVDMQKGLSTGADIYLTKPIRSSTLLTQIKAVLRREEILKQKQEQSIENSPSESKLEFQLRNIIYRQLGNPSLNVNLLADSLYMSRSKLYREWKKISDISIKDFINKIRFEEATVLIKEKEFSIQDAAKAVGFSDPNYFSTSFKKEFGYSPSKLIK